MIGVTRHKLAALEELWKNSESESDQGRPAALRVQPDDGCIAAECDMQRGHLGLDACLRASTTHHDQLQVHLVSTQTRPADSEFVAGAAMQLASL